MGNENLNSKQNKEEDDKKEDNKDSSKDIFARREVLTNSFGSDRIRKKDKK